MQSVTATVETQAEERRDPTLSEMLESGLFAQYHLQKAKAALAAGNLADAQYQLAASLAHDTLEEAKVLRVEIKRLSTKA
jgi:hypothetical protein